jgi:hypothetical protein
MSVISNNCEISWPSNAAKVIFSVIHRIVMGADYNVPDKSESQIIFFLRICNC